MASYTTRPLLALSDNLSSTGLIGISQQNHDPLILRESRPASLIYPERRPQTQAIQCVCSGTDAHPGRGHCRISGKKFYSDRAAADCFFDGELEEIVTSAVVENTHGGVAGELADGESAVGVLWSVGERIERVDTIEVIVGD